MLKSGHFFVYFEGGLLKMTATPVYQEGILIESHFGDSD